MNHDLISSFRPVEPTLTLDLSIEPDSWIQEQLDILHPGVHLAWEPRNGKWALWEDVGGVYHFIVAIADAEGRFETPSWANTIWWLDNCTPVAARNRWELERFLRKLDEGPQKEAAAIRKAHEPQIREGSNALYDLQIGKIQV